MRERLHGEILDEDISNDMNTPSVNSENIKSGVGRNSYSKKRPRRSKKQRDDALYGNYKTCYETRFISSVGDCTLERDLRLKYLDPQ